MPHHCLQIRHWLWVLSAVTYHQMCASTCNSCVASANVLSVRYTITICMYGIEEGTIRE